MKKFFAVLVSMALLVSVAVISPVWAGGDKVTGDKGQGATGTTGGGATTQTRAAD